jgi:hypothetical protein
MDATVNRPFWDGSRMRRRHYGEKRGYNLPLVATQLVGSALVIGIAAAVVSGVRRLAGLEKKGIEHA